MHSSPASRSSALRLAEARRSRFQLPRRDGILQRTIHHQPDFHRYVRHRIGKIVASSRDHADELGRKPLRLDNNVIGRNTMRALIAMIVAGLLLAAPAYAQSLASNENAPIGSTAVKSNDNSLIVIAQATSEKPKKKIQLRRVCDAGQIKCSCADTGTSACCTAQQTCSCQPTANCR
jgi:hypothetical protein